MEVRFLWMEIAMYSWSKDYENVTAMRCCDEKVGVGMEIAEMRPTWIFCAGTYRSASTTQYRIACDVVESTGNGTGCGYHTEPKLKEYDAKQVKYVVCKVFKCLPLDGFRGHPSYATTIHQERRLKALITVRNPLDIITSMMERHRRQMENKKDNEVPFDFHHRVTVDFPEWLGDLDRWASLGAFISRYEEFTQNLTGEVWRIADFLDISVSGERVDIISSRHTVDGIKAHKAQCKSEGRREDPHLPAIPGILFGTPGNWLDHLTPAQVDLMLEYNGNWMKRWDYL